MSKITKDIETYNELDKRLIKIAKNVKPLYYLTPINCAHEKTKFLLDNSHVPRFKYRDLEYNPNLIEKKLNSISIPKGSLSKIFTQKRDELLLMNEMLINRGNDDLIQKTSSRLYGTPSKKLVKQAEKILLDTDPIELKKDVSSAKIKIALENALRDNKLRYWKVEYSIKRLTTVYPAEKMITVGKDRLFSQIDPKRLGVHEVGVHVLRAANGHGQVLKIFATGLPGYLSTEEGLAAYLEQKTGNTCPERMRNYAGRVIAVDSVVNGLSFRECLDKLVSYRFTKDNAWDLTVRAYRGGGFVKDHVYLLGFEKVKEFEANGGDICDLYVGKVGIDDLPLVSELIDAGILKEPKYLPSFLQKSV
ncbi:MAG: DUF1704 domain-containing protein [Nanohaloarchaea archaeon]|nr:DUF1704 domain-containing protein [Candidatus Nanohaloarchaea archaeon]